MQVLTIEDAQEKVDLCTKLMRDLSYLEEKRNGLIVVLNDPSREKFRNLYYSLAEHGFTKEDSFSMIREGLLLNLKTLESSKKELLQQINNL